jgi:hypothetical protein
MTVSSSLSSSTSSMLSSNRTPISSSSVSNIHTHLSSLSVLLNVTLPSSHNSLPGAATPSPRRSVTLLSPRSLLHVTACRSPKPLIATPSPRHSVTLLSPRSMLQITASRSPRLMTASIPVTTSSTAQSARSVDPKDTCAICQDEFIADETTEEVDLLVHGKHGFHADCADEALQSDSRCSVDRAELTDENTEYLTLNRHGRAQPIKGRLLPEISSERRRELNDYINPAPVEDGIDEEESDGYSDGYIDVDNLTDAELLAFLREPSPVPHVPLVLVPQAPEPTEYEEI